MVRSITSYTSSNTRWITLYGKINQFMSKWFYDIFTGAATGERPLWFFLLERVLFFWSLAINEHGRHEDLRSSDRRSVIPYVHGRIELYCSNLPCLNLFSTSLSTDPFFGQCLNPCEVVPARAFYSSRSDSYNKSWGPTIGLGAGQTLCCRA
jgi:hypothetical protein